MCSLWSANANAKCSVPNGAQILNAEFEMLNEKKKEKVGMEKRNLRSTHRRGSYAKAPAPQSEFASLSIQHSAFSIGATAPRVPHSALAQQAALTPAPQSENSSFSIQHSAFSIGATAPRICACRVAAATGEKCDSREII